MKGINNEFCIIGKEKDSFIESYVGEPLTENDKQEYFFIVTELVHKFLEGDTIAETLTETFRKSFYQTEYSDNYSRFEEALKMVNTVCSEMEEKEGLVLKNINLAIAAVINNELYISQSNDAELYLVRKGYVSVISEGLSEGHVKPGQELFTNISSGNLETGDLVLMCSGRITRYITKNDLGRHFYGQKLPSVLHQLKDNLTTEVLGRIGALAIEYTKIDKTNSINRNSKSSVKFSKNNIMNHLGSLKEGVSSLIKIFNFIPHGNQKMEPTQNIEEPAQPDKPKTKLPKAPKIQLEFINKAKKYLDARFSPKTIKIGAGIGSLFIILILIFGITRGIQLKSINQFQDILDQARQEIADAKTKTDKTAAATLLANAEQSLRPALAEKYVRTEANKILTEIKNTRLEFDNVIIVDEPQLVTSLDQISDNGPTLGLVNTDSNGLFTYNNKELIEILVDSAKTPFELVDSDIIKTATAMTDTNSIFFLTTGNKILEYKDNLTQFFDTEDDQYQPATTIKAFGTRLYILDNENNQIWKYSKKRDRFSDAEGYLKASKLPPAKDMAIDGSIYLITDNNQIIRYYGGEISNFQIIDAPLLPPQNPTKIHTEEDASFVYILDQAENRVMIYFKNQKTDNLEYVSQYYFPSINNIINFAIDLDTKRLYINDASNIYLTIMK